MMPHEKFIGLVAHRFIGRNHGLFRVPTRNDRRMSGTFKIEDDGRLLIYDHGGESATQILAAIGLELSDLYPEPLHGHRKGSRRPFPAADCLRAVAFEGTVMLAIGTAMLAGEAWDRERLVLALERVNGALSAAGLEVKHVG